MSYISILLHSVHDSVHTFSMKSNFNDPKIYTGGVDITKWSTLSKPSQKEALSKSWYIYFLFKDPETGKMKRQTNIKGEANRYKTKKERFSYLKTMQHNLLMLLKEGFDPYQENDKLKSTVFGDSKKEEDFEITAKEKIKPRIETPKPVKDPIIPTVTVSNAFKEGLSIKKRELSTNSYRGYVSHIKRFEKWLKEKELDNKDISAVTKKVVIDHLNSVLQSSSARNRNNIRASLSSLFKTLENNDIINENFVAKINVLKSKPTRNKTYTPDQLEMISEYMEEEDPILMLFVHFVSYNYLRPIEVCRLRIEDLDVQDKKLYVKAKNKNLKTKIIPQILLDLLPDLSEMNPKDFLFTPDKIGGEWTIDENNKRDSFTKRFKLIKDHFGLGKEYGLYSFRHTSITKVYRQFRKTMSSFEAKSHLMLITGHTTMVALEQYLRDIDAELPEDYSEMLKS